ncbi:MAG: acetate/propionate family kinase [Acetivibrionales bacterium]
MKKIIVLNLGSTSFKFKLFDIDHDSHLLLAAGGMENIGGDNGAYEVTVNGSVLKGKSNFRLHIDAFDLCISIIKEYGALDNIARLDAVGYKAVHGGPISGAQLVDDGLLRTMEHYASFAPAHNPIYIKMMCHIKDNYPELRQVAYFETSFHSTIPLHRAVYGVPYDWVEKYGIRRYGFHGSSHEFIARTMGELEPSSRRVISLHLGGSSSLCAILDGKSIANSMGATPQSGVFHNNRVGDFDVFCLPTLVKQYNDGFNEVMKCLAQKSGFLGISGIGNDLREILAARENGDFRADLAIKAFVDTIIGYIGMYTSYLGGLDALAFTGGIGQRSSIIRSLVCNALSFLDVKIDSIINTTVKNGKISTEQSSVSVWVLETNEELMVARKSFNFLFE